MYIESFVFYKVRLDSDGVLTPTEPYPHLFRSRGDKSTRPFHRNSSSTLYHLQI